jgi:hypothetical protein
MVIENHLIRLGTGHHLKHGVLRHSGAVPPLTVWRSTASLCPSNGLLSPSPDVTCGTQWCEIALVDKVSVKPPTYKI